MKNRLLIVLAVMVTLMILALAGIQTATAQKPQLTPTPLAQWPPPTVTPGLEEGNTLLVPQETTVIALDNERECLQVPFSVPGDIGVYTNKVYSGTVTVSVSGGGQSAGIAYNDAFYLYIDQYGRDIVPAYVGPFYLYIDNAPAIDIIGYLPAYRDDHIYTFHRIVTI